MTKSATSRWGNDMQKTVKEMISYTVCCELSLGDYDNIRLIAKNCGAVIAIWALRKIVPIGILEAKRIVDEMGE